MKKLIRVFSMLLCVFLVLLSFSGCKNLDDMKKQQAFWKGKGKSEILFGGRTYKQLPYCEFFTPDFSIDKNGKYKIIKSGRVTKDDVPVLLSDVLGEGFSISANGELINYYGGSYFAESSVFEKYNTLINTFELSKLGVYENIEVDGHNFGKLTALTAEETETVTSALESGGEFTRNGKTEDYDFYNVLSIIKIDESMNFSTNYCDIYYYYNVDKAAAFIEGREITLGDEYKEAIKDIIKKYGYDDEKCVVEG